MYRPMHSKRPRQRRSIAEMNVVPYIDVMLVLLVIFMIATPLLTPGVKVNLPQAKAQAIQTKDNQPLIVSVDEQGRYYLNVNANPSQTLTAHDLIVRVAARLELDKTENKTPMVMVKGDEQASYGQVVGAMVLLQRAGVNQVGLITQDPGDGGQA